MPDVVIAHVDEDCQPRVVIRYGLLRRVVGRAARHDGLVFVPVWFNFDVEPCVWQKGRTTPSYPLSAFVGDPPPPALAACRDEYGEPMDAAWVRARIPAVFQFAPATLIRPEGSKHALLDHAFVACERVEASDVWEAIPFVCVSDDLKATLVFSQDGPPEEVRRRIAAAFWGLLLREPNDLSTFHDGYMSCGYDDAWVAVEYRGDRFSVDYQGEEDAYDDELG